MQLQYCPEVLYIISVISVITASIITRAVNTVQILQYCPEVLYIIEISYERILFCSTKLHLFNKKCSKIGKFFMCKYCKL